MMSKPESFLRQFKKEKLAFFDSVFRFYMDIPEVLSAFREMYCVHLKRMMVLNFFKSPLNNMLKCFAYITTRMGIKEEGDQKTVRRLLHKESFP